MDSNLWYRGTKAADFRSMPGIAGGSSTGKGDAAKSRRSRLRRVPQNGNGAASQGSGTVWSRCFSASRCASSSFLSANLAPQYWHQNGCHRHSVCFGGGSCALSTRLINLVLRNIAP